MSERPVFTYQTRPVLDAGQAAVLDGYAELYGRTERSLFAAVQAGGKLNDPKREFLPRFGITARQFNAVRIGLEGKIDSIKQLRPDLIIEAQVKIKKAAKGIAKLAAKRTPPVYVASTAVEHASRSSLGQNTIVLWFQKAVPRSICT